MTAWLNPTRWTITGRLVVVATAPLLLMFAAMSITVYTTGRRDSQATAAAHGAILAQALAETCRYGVFSGNTDSLEGPVRRFLQGDGAVAFIQVLDDRRQPLLSVGTLGPDGPLFERPIASEVTDVDVFTGGAPHAAHDDRAAAHAVFRAGPAIGYVRVQMSAGPILDAQLQRLLLAGAAMLASFAISVCVALYLGRLIRTPLTRILRVIRDIRQGRLDVRFDDHAGGELRELQSAIEEMARGLAVKRHELEAEVAQRTHQLQLAVAKAAEVDAQRRRLLAHSHDAVEEERRHIAIELHDQFNASLLAMKMRVAALVARGGAAVAPAEIEAIAARLTEAIEQLYRDARAIVRRLRPEILDTLGLRGALSEGVRLFNDRASGCTLVLDIAEPLPRLSDKLAIATYRVFQEALNNIVKHAGATRGTITLRHDPAARTLELQITDNGRGFDLARRNTGFGLLGMRERVDALGGHLEIESHANGGTRVRVSLPECEPADR